MKMKSILKWFKDQKRYLKQFLGFLEDIFHSIKSNGEMIFDSIFSPNLSKFSL